MNDSGTWLLPGERSLWTGRPGHARLTPADAGMALYLAVALVVITVFWSRSRLNLPGALQVGMAIVWVGAVLQTLGMLVRLLVIGPLRQRRAVYEVTNYRVIVTDGAGPGPGHVASIYLDQVEPPVVRRRQDGAHDVLLRPSADGPRGRALAGLFRSSGLGLAVVDPVSKLPACRDAEYACQVIAQARQQMIDGEIDAPPPPAHAAMPVPDAITLAPGEVVLWTGRPARIPWWFGGRDIYFTAFMLAWLAFAAIMAVVIARSGPAAFLVVLIPFCLVCGVYPAVGRLVHRRLLIGRSSYVLTSRGLIATWRPLRGDAPVVVRASLGTVLPPSVRGTSVFAGPVRDDYSRQRNGWRELTWPATTMAPPALIGLTDSREIAQLIGAAQVAARTSAGV